jgi:hypothetical protein
MSVIGSGVRVAGDTISRAVLLFSPMDSACTLQKDERAEVRHRALSKIVSPPLFAPVGSKTASASLLPPAKAESE